MLYQLLTRFQDNIIIEDGIVKLVDYGLPSWIRENHSDFGTKVFRAPEHLGCPGDQVEPTQEGDVYALAMTFYEVARVSRYALMGRY